MCDWATAKRLLSAKTYSNETKQFWCHRRNSAEVGRNQTSASFYVPLRSKDLSGSFCSSTTWSDTPTFKWSSNQSPCRWNGLLSLPVVSNVLLDIINWVKLIIKLLNVAVLRVILVFAKMPLNIVRIEMSGLSKICGRVIHCSIFYSMFSMFILWTGTSNFWWERILKNPLNIALCSGW